MFNLKDIKFILFNTLNRYRQCNYLLKLWTVYKGGGQVADNNIDAVLDFFPRCGNTFLYFVYKELYPDQRVAHHIHGISQLATGLRFNKPVYFMIRNPADAISSLILRSDIKAYRFCINNYLAMYEYVWIHRQDIILLKFEDLEELGRILRKLKPEGHPYPEKEIERIRDQAKAGTIQADRETIGEDVGAVKMSLPSEHKERDKERIKSKLEHYPAMKRAEEYFRKLREYEMSKLTISAGS